MFSAFNLVILGVVVGLLYRASLPPKGLRHLPRANFWLALYSIIFGLSFEETYSLVEKKLLEKHGLVLVWKYGSWSLSLGRAEDVKKVANELPKFPKVLLTDMLPGHVVSQFYGDNIVYSNSSDWRRHRRVINKFFQKKWDIKLIIESVKQLTSNLETLSTSGTVDVHYWVERLTLDILGKQLFDVEFNALQLDGKSEENELYDFATLEVNKPQYLFFPFLNRFRKAALAKVYQFDALLDHHIETKRKALLDKTIDPDNDALSAMIHYNELESENTADKKLSDMELKWTFKMLFVAGHDTTAMAISAMLYHLALNPEIQTQLREEIEKHIPRSNLEKFESSDLDKIELLDQVICENLRLYSPVAVNVHRIFAGSDEPLQFQGYHVPKDTHLQQHFWHIHHDKLYWNKPDSFVPSRFDKGNKENSLNQWFPFNTGPRQCMGISLTLLEQKVALVHILHKFEVQWPSHLPKTKLQVSIIELLSPRNLQLEFVARR